MLLLPSFYLPLPREDTVFDGFTAAGVRVSCELLACNLFSSLTAIKLPKDYVAYRCDGWEER